MAQWSTLMPCNREAAGSSCAKSKAASLESNLLKFRKFMNDMNLTNYTKDDIENYTQHRWRGRLVVFTKQRQPIISTRNKTHSKFMQPFIGAETFRYQPFGRQKLLPISATIMSPKCPVKHTPSALNAGAKRSDVPYGHASLLLLGEGSEATEQYNK